MIQGMEVWITECLLQNWQWSYEADGEVYYINLGYGRDYAVKFDNDTVVVLNSDEFGEDIHESFANNGRVRKWRKELANKASELLMFSNYVEGKQSNRGWLGCC